MSERDRQLEKDRDRERQRESVQHCSHAHSVYCIHGGITPPRVPILSARAAQLSKQRQMVSAYHGPRYATGTVLSVHSISKPPCRYTATPPTLHYTCSNGSGVAPCLESWRSNATLRVDELAVDHAVRMDNGRNIDLCPAGSIGHISCTSSWLLSSHVRERSSTPRRISSRLVFVLLRYRASNGGDRVRRA